MGLFSNPLGYAGYPPGASAPATVVNSTVRAATATEAAAATRTDIYLSPATASSSIILDFASPPPIGSTAPNTGAFTTLTSSGNTTLATGVGVTSASLANGANTGALVTNINNGASGANSTVNILSGNGTAGTQTLNVLGGTRAGVANIGTGAAAHTLNLGNSAALIGFFGKTAATQQTQGANVTNSVTAGGSANTIANFTDLTVYANDSAAIRNDIYQLTVLVSTLISAMRTYGLLT